MEENKSSNRRSFVRKLLGLGAAAGATSLLLNADRSLIPLAQAGSGSGQNVQIDQTNYGIDMTVVSSSKNGGAAFRGWQTSTSGWNQGLSGYAASPDGAGVEGGQCQRAKQDSNPDEEPFYHLLNHHRLDFSNVIIDQAEGFPAVLGEMEEFMIP